MVHRGSFNFVCCVSALIVPHPEDPELFEQRRMMICNCLACESFSLEQGEHAAFQLSLISTQSTATHGSSPAGKAILLSVYSFLFPPISNWLINPCLLCVELTVP